MKYIDAERLKESVQVEFDKGDLSKCPQGMLSEFGRGYHVAMSWILNTIDSLQQEQPEEDLEKEMYDKATSECDIIWNEMGFQLCYDNLIEAFVAGAEWAMKRKEEKK